MNERIKELAKQSGLIQYDTDSKLDEVKKFAELIVRGCAAEAALLGVSNYDNDDIAWASATISKGIKKRFGVEE